MTTQTFGHDEAHASLVPSLDPSQIPSEQLSVHDQIRAYYGDILAGSDDLKTNATCCSESTPPKYVLDVMGSIDDEIMARFYGCGSPIPPALEGCTVVDLGCGVGRDVYVLSKLVGPQGRVIGVDMTPSQLEVALRHKESQAQTFGFEHSNVDFVCGYIEDLAEAGIADNSVDLVVSNCVINLSPFKEQVFKEIYRVLKPGGELYFADVFCDRRMPESLKNDPVLRGECLGGALYWEDFRRLMRSVGFESFAVVVDDEIHVADLNLVTAVGFTGFRSRTIRAIKAEGLEDREENYGQVATYLGTIPEMPRYFDLTEDIRLIKGRPVALSGNLATMLQQSRYGKSFTITDPKAHRGPFIFAQAQEALAARKGKRIVGADTLAAALKRRELPSFEERVNAPAALKAEAGGDTLQVNITYACNLACRHCYLECTPNRTEYMDRAIMEKVLQAYESGSFTTLDITGGSPELHPDFAWFVTEAGRIARAKGGNVIVRSNLTLLDQPEYQPLIATMAEAGVQINASLPYYRAGAANAQRGAGVFERAVSVIRELNNVGYGTSEGNLRLDLAYNVSGPFLPPPQDLLEDLYTTELERQEGIAFDNLFAFNNWPMGRFAQDLMEANLLDDYLQLLVDNFNALAVGRMMCHNQVNVDIDGRLYDCEVNHVFELPIQLPVDSGSAEGGATAAANPAAVDHAADSPSTRDATIDDLLAGPLPERAIRTHAACFSCSAGSGSSCGGSLVREYAS